jgi:hypothetical protein
MSIDQKIRLIATQFVNSDCRSKAVFTNADTRISSKLTSFSDFSNTFNNQIKTAGTIYYKTANWSTNFTPTTQTLTDINMTDRFTNESTLLSLLNKIRICYNLLNEPYKLIQLQKGNLPNIDTYQVISLNEGTLTYRRANLSECNTALTDLLCLNINEKTTNFTAVKRVLQAFEMIIHVYIAMKIEQNPETTPITDATVALINNKNLSIRDSSSGEYAIFRSQLSDMETRYNTNLDTVDNQNTLLKELKSDVKAEKIKFESHSNIFNKNNIVYYIFLILFIIACGFLLYSIQYEKNERSKLIVGGVFALSVISLLIMYFLNMTYLKEDFTSPEATQTNLNNSIYQYLDDTLFLSVIEDHADTYKSINGIVDKEINRYDIINHQLKLEKTALNDVQADDYRNARVLQYRVYLFLHILIILSITTFIFLQIGQNIIVFTIALLLVLFMIYIYILNTENLVHTDAKKLYWGQPSII